MATIAARPAAATPVQRQNSFIYAISDALVLVRRHMRHIPRNPELLFWATIQPVMFVVLFRYVFGGAIKIDGMSYANFLMPGIFVQTVAFGSTLTTTGLAQDMTRGLIDRFRSLPMSRSAVLVGRTVFDLVLNTFVTVVMLSVGLLVGFRPEADVVGFVGGFALLLLISFSFSWIAATMGMLVRTVEAANSAGFVWLFPLTFLSSAFVQPDTMPGPLRVFAENQPFTIMVDAVRGLFLDAQAGRDVWLAVAWCLGLLAIFIPLSMTLYRRRTGN